MHKTGELNTRFGAINLYGYLFTRKIDIEKEKKRKENESEGRQKGT